jgi:hypothetical protein
VFDFLKRLEGETKQLAGDVLGFDRWDLNWSLQDGGFMQKIKSSLMVRIWLFFTDSIQSMRLIRHQMERLLGPFRSNKKPWRQADARQPLHGALRNRARRQCALISPSHLHRCSTGVDGPFRISRGALLQHCGIQKSFQLLCSVYSWWRI